MEKCVREILYDALKDLTEEQFKDFKWKLRDCHYEGRGTICWGQLEAADRRVVVDLVYGCYGDDEACISVSLEVLGRINARNVAGKVQRVLDQSLTPQAPAEDYKLEYKKYVKEKFQTMKDQNSLPGEFVLLKERYSRLIILNHHRPEQEREHEILDSGWQHAQIMSKRHRSSITIQKLFQPDETGLIPDTVVLQGAAGIGKTMTARKIMLDWASGELYQDLFDYTFYIHCRGMNLGTEYRSMADMISALKVNKHAINVLLNNPQKLLFVIDGFDELRFSFDQPEDRLCSDPWKKASTSVLLSSLFRKILLPKSRLIITTRPTALKKLTLLLGRSRYAEILGFSPEDRRKYFHKFFKNKEQGEKAFRTVKQDPTLFTMCFVPISCWIICTVMKQQLDRGENLVQTSNTVTAIYMLYLYHLFKSSQSHGKELVQTNLRGLCSLAAEGIWKREILFWGEEIQKYRLDQEDSLPLFLNENIFKKDLECICAYSFIHLSFQEFFAALSYLLEDSLPPYQDVKTLLESYRTSRHDLELTVYFLFGLLNEEPRMRDMKEKFGWKISPRIKELLLQWVKNNSGIGTSDIKLIRLLYETQDEDFLKRSLVRVTEFGFAISSFTDMDIVSLSFCLKNSYNMEKLNLSGPYYRKENPQSIQHLYEIVKYRCRKLREIRLSHFREGNPQSIQRLCEAVMYQRSKLREIRLSHFDLTASDCEELSHILITKQTLVSLNLLCNKLGDLGTKQLCEALRHPDCKLQNLSLMYCKINTALCRDLSTVFSTNQNLINLELIWTELRGSELKLLFEGLKHPNCRLQSISLFVCELTSGCCKELSQVLIASKTLVNLDLSRNKIGKSGIKHLCEALRHPTCKLQTFSLEECGITSASCGYLSSVFCTNQNLMNLQLNCNKLKDSGVKLLSEGLRHPDCKLQSIMFDSCNLTAACCEDLSFVLCSNQSLGKLSLLANNLGDRGMKLLCSGLKHPNCRLRELWLGFCELSRVCCEDLSYVLGTNQKLIDLFLDFNELEDSGLGLLCKGLKHPNCILQKLSLSRCKLSSVCCEDLSSVLCTNQTLTYLDLSENELGDSGFRLLCKGLKHPNCSLQTLRFSDCGLTSACCGDLASLFRTIQRLTDIHLLVLNLEESEFMLLREVLEHPDCKLRKQPIFKEMTTEQILQEFGIWCYHNT